MAKSNTTLLREQNEALCTENAVLRTTIDELTGKLKLAIWKGNRAGPVVNKIDFKAAAAILRANPADRRTAQEVMRVGA